MSERNIDVHEKLQELRAKQMEVEVTDGPSVEGGGDDDEGGNPQPKVFALPAAAAGSDAESSHSISFNLVRDFDKNLKARNLSTKKLEKLWSTRYAAFVDHDTVSKALVASLSLGCIDLTPLGLLSRGGFCSFALQRQGILFQFSDINREEVVAHFERNPAIDIRCEGEEGQVVRLTFRAFIFAFEYYQCKLPPVMPFPTVFEIETHKALCKHVSGSFEDSPFDSFLLMDSYAESNSVMRPRVNEPLRERSFYVKFIYPQGKARTNARAPVSVGYKYSSAKVEDVLDLITVRWIPPAEIKKIFGS
jgi:hypothetical protein